MAKYVYKNAHFVWDSVDLSDHVRVLTLTEGGDVLDDTGMGDDTRSNAGGLKNWSIDVELFQDFAAGEVDATLNTDVMTTKTVTIRPDTGAVAATNPQRSGTGLLSSYNPQAGTVGDMAIATIHIDCAGDLERTTS